MWDDVFEVICDISVGVLWSSRPFKKAVWWFLYGLLVLFLSVQFGVAGFLGGLGVVFLIHTIASA